MKWLFLIGCNNSGTSILKTLLGKHPDIDEMRGEGQDLKVKNVKEYLPYPQNYLLPNPAVFFNQKGEPIWRVWTERIDVFRYPITPVWLVKHFFIKGLKERKGSFIMEKSPTAAVRSLWLQENFEKPHFIFLTRNGYAVSEGIRRRYNIVLAAQRFKACEEQGHSKPLESFREMTVDRAAKHWNLVNKVMVEDSAKLSNFIWITYEELCEKPEETLQKIMAFLKVEAFDYNKIVNEPIDMGKERPITQLKNMNQNSFEKLSSSDINNIRFHASLMLDHFDYHKPVV